MIAANLTPMILNNEQKTSRSTLWRRRWASACPSPVETNVLNAMVNSPTKTRSKILNLCSPSERLISHEKLPALHVLQNQMVLERTHQISFHSSRTKLQSRPVQGNEKRVSPGAPGCLNGSACASLSRTHNGQIISITFDLEDAKLC